MKGKKMNGIVYLAIFGSGLVCATMDCGFKVANPIAYYGVTVAFFLICWAISDISRDK